MNCSHPEAEGREAPAARLVRKPRKAWMGLQDVLKVSIPTAINTEIHKWEQTDR